MFSPQVPEDRAKINKREFPGGTFQFIMYVEKEVSFRTGLL